MYSTLTSAELRSAFEQMAICEDGLRGMLKAFMGAGTSSTLSLSSICLWFGGNVAAGRKLEPQVLDCLSGMVDEVNVVTIDEELWVIYPQRKFG